MDNTITTSVQQRRDNLFEKIYCEIDRVHRYNDDVLTYFLLSTSETRTLSIEKCQLTTTSYLTMLNSQ